MNAMRPAAIVMFVLVLCGSALAFDGLDLAAVQAPLLSLAQTAEDAGEGTPVEPFAEDSFALYSYGSVALGNHYGDFYQGAVGGSWYFADNLSLSAEVLGGFFDADERTGEDTPFAGMNLALRWHFCTEPDWSLYAEVLGGFFHASRSHVERGTNFQFTPSIGVGATRRFSDSLHLMGGVRWYHVSNAYIQGTERNFGIEALMVYFGLMMPF